jgi:hypothetical protein
MRSGVLPASVAVAIVVTLAFGGCTDDASTPGGNDLPGIDDGTDDGYRDTMLPGDHRSPVHRCAQPDAGRDGAPVPGDPDPADDTPVFGP